MFHTEHLFFLSSTFLFFWKSISPYTWFSLGIFSSFFSPLCGSTRGIIFMSHMHFSSKNACYSVSPNRALYRIVWKLELRVERHILSGNSLVGVSSQFVWGHGSKPTEHDFQRFWKNDPAGRGWVESLTWNLKHSCYWFSLFLRPVIDLAFCNLGYTITFSFCLSHLILLLITSNNLSW